MKADWSLAAAFLASHPLEASSVLERAPAETTAAVLCRNPPSVIAETLHRMAPAEAAAVLTHLPARRIHEVLAALSPGAAALALRSLAPHERARLLDAVPEEIARSLRAALLYPEGSAASMMDSNVLVFPLEITVVEARRRVRRRSRRTGNYLYVVDGQQRLCGAIAQSELMLAAPNTVLATLIRSPVVRISAQASVNMILAHEGWRELHAIPVVDSGGFLIGVLRRETYERLRQERAGRSADNTGGLGMALVELAWTAMVSTADEMAGSIRPEPAERQERRADDA